MTDSAQHYKTRRPYHHHQKIINHLQMIQRVIGRMAACSFAVKAFSTVYLLIGLWAIANPLVGPLASVAVYLPICMMWWLDGFYLRQERLFRKLYDSVRIKTDTNYSLSSCEFKKWIPYGGVISSNGFFLFYGAQFLCLTVFALLA